MMAGPGRRGGPVSLEGRASECIERFPTTRYQGSKRRLLRWLDFHLAKLPGECCLDLFGGTGAVAYLLKAQGRQVTTNDYLRFNQCIARALVVNEGTILPPQVAPGLWERSGQREYREHIADNFSGIFYLDEENYQLDTAIQNIVATLRGPRRQLAMYALFQACLAKRPFNLFHRANLPMRTAKVERSFGNKTTWETPFLSLFTQALAQANRAVFASGKVHRALCSDCCEVRGGYDLVYMDPPYLNGRGQGIDYRDFYHFLEGLTVYKRWPSQICEGYRHRPLHKRDNPWGRPEGTLRALEQLVDIHRKSRLAISYRGDGVPSVNELVGILQRGGQRNVEVHQMDQRYALSRGKASEVLLVSQPR